MSTLSRGSAQESITLCSLLAKGEFSPVETTPLGSSGSEARQISSLLSLLRAFQMSRRSLPGTIRRPSPIKGSSMSGAPGSLESN
jgi:hypothetical protein